MPTIKRNHHFVFIEAPIALVFPEIVSWGEAAWWPKKSDMKFVKKTEGDVAVGTRYVQKVKGAFAPHWVVEVSKIVPNKLIERTFKTGMFRGYEVVKLEERSNGTRVDYEMLYFINGFINKFMWSFKFKEKHDENLKLILATMQETILTKQKENQEKELEG